MPRNFVTVNGTVNIDGNPREKKVSIFTAGGSTVPTIVGQATSSVVDGSYSVEVLKERDGYLMGIAYGDYGKTWSPSTAFALNDLAIPLTSNTHWYKATTAGTSGASEPQIWPTSGGTAADGTVVWTDMGLIESPVARGPFQASDPIKDSNVIFLTRFQESFSPNEVTGATGLMVGPPNLSSPGKWGASKMTFNGVDSYYRLPAVNLGTGDWTIDMWIQFHALSPSATVVPLYIGDLASNANRIQLGLRTNNSIEGYHQDGASGQATPLTAANAITATNTWYHISLEKYGTNLNLYVNGVSSATVTTPVTGITPAGTAFTYVATGRNASTQRWMNCSVGEIRISNIARYLGASSFTVPAAPYTL